MGWRIEVVDPCGADALQLLHHAALDARALYPDLIPAGTPMPGNAPAAPGCVYLVAYADDGADDSAGDGTPLGCGALRPIDAATAEVRRMYVMAAARGRGIARALLARLEQEALALGYRTLRLETGVRQQPAVALYAACGFVRIPAFGPYVGDPTSVCFEKRLA